MRHSDWLRDGLATTLLQIAVLHKEARLHVTGITPQGFVDETIATLPGLKQDTRLLISLGRQLPWLIEAAPHALLAALEHAETRRHARFAVCRAGSAGAAAVASRTLPVSRVE